MLRACGFPPPPQAQGDRIWSLANAWPWGARATQAGCSPLAVAIATSSQFGVQGGCQKNTIDLQWKMRANYNARPCDRERKAAGATTMENNGKNNAQNNGNRRTSGRVLTHRRVISTSHKIQSPAAERRRAHTSRTRISAIAHPSADRTLKSAPVLPAGLSKKPAILAHMRSPCPQARRKRRAFRKSQYVGRLPCHELRRDLLSRPAPFCLPRRHQMPPTELIRRLSRARA